MVQSAAVGAGRVTTYSQEASFGVPAASPTQKVLRCLMGAKFQLDRTTSTSKEMSSSRQVQALTFGTKKGTGSIPFELSYGSQDDLLEAVMGGTWITNVLKMGNVKRSFAFEDQYPDINLNEQNLGVIFSGFSLSVKPDTPVEGSFDFLFKDQKSIQYADDGVTTIAFAATTMTRSAGSFITDGFAVGDSVNITGAATAANNRYATPAVITTLTATVMTCSAAAFTVDAAKTGVTICKTLGAPTAANTNPVYDSFTGTILLDGTAVAIVTAIDLKMAQASNGSNIVFDPTIQQVSLGTINLTGTLVVRFVNNVLKQKFLTGTSADISFTLGSGAGGGKSLKFDASKCYFTGVTNDTGENELTQSIAFTGIYDATDATSLIITRIA